MESIKKYILNRTMLMVLTMCMILVAGIILTVDRAVENERIMLTIVYVDRTDSEIRAEQFFSLADSVMAEEGLKDKIEQKELGFRLVTPETRGFQRFINKYNVKKESEIIVLRGTEGQLIQRAAPNFDKNYILNIIEKNS